MKKIRFALLLIVILMAVVISFTSCGETEPSVENNGISPTETTKCEHNYTSQVTTEATCGNDGVETFTCSLCNDSYTKAIAATGNHTYTSQVTTEATCSNDGVKTFTCSVCNDTYTETVDAKGHTYISQVTTEATCANDGVETFTCSVCNDSYTKAIAATGNHNYKSKVITEATCAKEGVKKYTCSACNDSYTKAIAATGNHNYKSKVTTEATCTKEGVKKYTCSVCNDSYTETVAAKGHKWQNATCTLPKTCSVCKLADGIALGHTSDARICARCGTDYFKEVRKFVMENGDYEFSVDREWWAYTYHIDTDSRLKFIYEEDENVIEIYLLGSDEILSTEIFHITFEEGVKNKCGYYYSREFSSYWNNMEGKIDVSTITSKMKEIPYEEYNCWCQDCFWIAVDTHGADAASQQGALCLRRLLPLFDKFLGEHFNLSIDNFGFKNFQIKQ